MALVALHGGEEFGSAAELTIALLRPFGLIILAPLAQPADSWEDIERQACKALRRPVLLAHPAHPTANLSEDAVVLIPGGDPAIAALRVTEELRTALLGRNVVAASAGAMMLGEEMAAGCPEHCHHTDIVPGLGLIGGMVTPHVESLSPGWISRLGRAVGSRPWRRIPTGEALVVLLSAENDRRELAAQVACGGGSEHLRLVPS
ncbi:MAG: hypothetical protein NVSMB32_15320 [Actinomycetota bacterium]